VNPKQNKKLADLLFQAERGEILITEVEYTMGNIHSHLFVKYFDNGGNEFHRKYNTDGTFTELQI
jgi:hypothetical protein